MERVPVSFYKRGFIFILEYFCIPFFLVFLFNKYKIDFISSEQLVFSYLIVNIIFASFNCSLSKKIFKFEVVRISRESLVKSGPLRLFFREIIKLFFGPLWFILYLLVVTIKIQDTVEARNAAERVTLNNDTANFAKSIHNADRYS